MKGGSRFSYHQLWWLSVSYYLYSHKKNNTFLLLFIHQTEFQTAYFFEENFLSWCFLVNVYCKQRRLRNMKNYYQMMEIWPQGLLLLLLSPAPGCQTMRQIISQFTFACCLSADERRHSPGCLRLLWCNNVWRFLPTMMCQKSLQLQTVLLWNIQNFALCSELVYIKQSYFRDWCLNT